METVILERNGEEIVVKLHNFYSVRCEGEPNYSKLLGNGFCYQVHITDDGQPAKDFWSGFIKVDEQVLANLVCVSLHCIKRKVILHKRDNNLLIVADYQRRFQHLPYAVIVPVYAEKEDMVLIQGEQLHDIWYGHIQRVDRINRTVDVFFYIESKRHNNVYVRKTVGRHARNTVPLDSVIGIANGQWINQSNWQKQL